MGGDRVGDRSCRQRDERRLDVGRRNVATGKPCVEPARVEQIAARALRRHPSEVRLREQRREQRGVDVPGPRPRAVPVEAGAAMARVPEIEQHVAGARVESTHLGPHRQIGNVGDAADIDDRTVPLAPEERRMKGRHERRTLPAGGDVATPEVGDDRNARSLGDARRIVELQRPAFVGAVTQRLAMHARRDHILRRESRQFDCGLDSLRIRVGKRIGGARRAGKLIVAWPLQRRQFGGELGREGNVRCGQQQARPCLGRGKVGDDSVDAVHAGAGHHPGVNLAHGGARQAANRPRRAARSRTSARA